MLSNLHSNLFILIHAVYYNQVQAYLYLHSNLFILILHLEMQDISNHDYLHSNLFILILTNYLTTL